MIQANPSGVIQTAAGTQQQQQALAAATAMQKVVYVAKPPNSTVIHTTPGNAVQVRNKVRRTGSTEHPPNRTLLINSITSHTDPSNLSV